MQSDHTYAGAEQGVAAVAEPKFDTTDNRILRIWDDLQCLQTDFCFPQEVSIFYLSDRWMNDAVTVLDVGSGNGYFINRLASLFPTKRYLSDGGRAHMVCIRNVGISNLPSPIQQFQSYEATEDDIERFFTKLLFEGTYTSGERIRDDLLKKGETRDALEKKSKDLACAFCRTVEESRACSITIGLPDVKPGEQVPDIEDAYVDGDAGAVNLPDTPTMGIEWKPLYALYKQTNQTGWLDEIKQIVCEPEIAWRRRLKRFVTRDQTSVGPMLWRIEKVRPRA